MATKANILALFLAVAALGVAVFDRPPDVPTTSGPDPEVAALEEQVESLSRTVEELTARTPEPPARDADGGTAARTPADPSFGPAGAPEAVAGGAALKDLVDDAVEKKTREVVDDLKAKQDKKPTMDVFAATLELSESQRRNAEQEVVRAQSEILSVLDTPTNDGKNFLDELVEVFARTRTSLEVVHARGVVHRDVKPDNIFEGRSGTARLNTAHGDGKGEPRIDLDHLGERSFSMTVRTVADLPVERDPLLMERRNSAGAAGRRKRPARPSTTSARSAGRRPCSCPRGRRGSRES